MDSRIWWRPETWDPAETATEVAPCLLLPLSSCASYVLMSTSRRQFRCEGKGPKSLPRGWGTARRSRREIVVLGCPSQAPSRPLQQLAPAHRCRRFFRPAPVLTRASRPDGPRPTNHTAPADLDADQEVLLTRSAQFHLLGSAHCSPGSGDVPRLVAMNNFNVCSAGSTKLVVREGGRYLCSGVLALSGPCNADHSVRRGRGGVWFAPMCSLTARKGTSNGGSHDRGPSGL